MKTKTCAVRFGLKIVSYHIPFIHQKPLKWVKCQTGIAFSISMQHIDFHCDHVDLLVYCSPQLNNLKTLSFMIRHEIVLRASGAKTRRIRFIRMLIQLFGLSPVLGKMYKACNCIFPRTPDAIHVL